MRLAGQKLTLYCDILAGLWAPRADPQLNPALWKPTWPKDWPRYGQEGKHVEAKKWALWAPAANPQLNPGLWRPTWPKDWPKYGQEGKDFDAKKWQKEVGIRTLRLKGEKLILRCKGSRRRSHGHA